MVRSCPRCPVSFDPGAERPVCPVHGAVVPLSRPDAVGYATFAEVLDAVDGVPIYLPWPLSPGWSVTDFGFVGSGPTLATMATVLGSSDADGPIEVSLVTEEPGVGLGARWSGCRHLDPETRFETESPAARVRLGARSVPLWLVESGSADPLLARASFAGEADGRWLWLIVRPASAALLLGDEWILADATRFGPQALDLPFGGPRPAW